MSFRPARGQTCGRSACGSRDDPARAISFIAELRQKALSLSDNHGLYPTIADGRSPIRRLNHRDYRIVYQVSPALERVDILYIHHGSRA